MITFFAGAGGAAAVLCAVAIRLGDAGTAVALAVAALMLLGLAGLLEAAEATR